MSWLMFQMVSLSWCLQCLEGGMQDLQEFFWPSTSSACYHIDWQYSISKLWSTHVQYPAVLKWLCNPNILINYRVFWSWSIGTQFWQWKYERAGSNQKHCYDRRVCPSHSLIPFGLQGGVGPMQGQVSKWWLTGTSENQGMKAGFWALRALQTYPCISETTLTLWH